MTPEQFAKIQREFLIRAEKESAFFLLAEFEELKREISAHLIRENLKDISFISRILAIISQKFPFLAIRFEQTVTRSQRNVINFARESVKDYLSLSASSIFEPDAEALGTLIGRTQNNSTLARFFSRMQPEIEQRAKTAMLESFSLGESPRQMAKKLNDVSGIGLSRALTISRTETSSAFRRASVSHYKASRSVIGYRFLSALTPRTCLVCWNLHGRVFKLKTKPNIHVNCRCSIVPVLLKDEKIQTGADRFAKLEAGYQRQLLGVKRFEMFQAGKGLSDFVGREKSKEYGQRFFVKKLLDFS